MVRHHFTVDVEEYFQVSALEAHAPYASWDAYESRVERGMDVLLGLLSSAQARGTFFTLGWVAERHPALVRRIVEEGHELASHGWRHRRVTTLMPAEFRESVRRSKALLEDLTGREVVGYRAPSFTIVAETAWALEILAEEGYRYDSSVYPGRAGHPVAPRGPYKVTTPAGDLTEYPIATWRAGRTWPAGGGAYLRLLPLGLIERALRQAEAEGRAGMFYIHPWEVDPEQPRLPVGLKTRLRHYGGLGRTEARLRRLLARFRFGAIRESAAATVPTSVPATTPVAP